MLQTDRLIVREFTADDVDALFAILRDREVNTFLPWYPLRRRDEAERFLRDRMERVQNTGGAFWAVCLREDHVPAGYLSLSGDDSHDLGYGLKREFWGRGMTTEAGRACLEHIRAAGLPYITATHDVNNPASGAVMKKLGMSYRYTYQEQWQPKDITVTFRMYQLNLDGQRDRTYRAYWDRYPVHYVETEL